MRKHIHRWLQADKLFKTVAAFATAVVTYLSLKPPSPNAKPWTLFFFRGDLVLHFSCYFGLTFLYFFAFYIHKRSVLKAFLSALLLVGFLETLQLIPFFQRFFDLSDLFANLFGGLCATLIIKGFFYYSVKE